MDFVAIDFETANSKRTSAVGNLTPSEICNEIVEMIRASIILEVI